MERQGLSAAPVLISCCLYGVEEATPDKAVATRRENLSYMGWNRAMRITDELIAAIGGGGLVAATNPSVLLHWFADVDAVKPTLQALLHYFLFLPSTHEHESLQKRRFKGLAAILTVTATGC